ncbi:MAG: PIN domain-containing protein [Anaerolineales bacterium]|nr:PIN domain-containing protein [Anaerolineales bacterium]
MLDTNVVFEGLTKQAGLAGTIINAWFAGLLQVCVSDALAYEYADVMARKLSPHRLETARITLATLLSMAEEIVIYYRWRPSSPDPSDEFVIDCVLNANAILVTSNIKDFRLAQTTLGLRVMTPFQFLSFLAQQEE